MDHILGFLCNVRKSGHSVSSCKLKRFFSIWKEYWTVHSFVSKRLGKWVTPTAFVNLLNTYCTLILDYFYIGKIIFSVSLKNGWLNWFFHCRNSKVFHFRVAQRKIFTEFPKIFNKISIVSQFFFIFSIDFSFNMTSKKMLLNFFHFDATMFLNFMKPNHCEPYKIKKWISVFYAKSSSIFMAFHILFVLTYDLLHSTTSKYSLCLSMFFHKFEIAFMFALDCSQPNYTAYHITDRIENDSWKC